MSVDKFNQIVSALSSKARAKQSIYRQTATVFKQMKDIAAGMARQLDDHFNVEDPHVNIEFSDKGDFEFHLKFSGDLLVYTMHSNIVTFPPEHLLSKSPYIQEDAERKYFGQIMVYNFMADSIKYNRLQDQGYLVARILLNKDLHFYIEGVRQLNFLHPDIAQNKMDPAIIENLIQEAMLLAIDTDLTGRNVQEIKFITLGQKLANQMAPAIEKVGFNISAQAR